MGIVSGDVFLAMDNEIEEECSYEQNYWVFRDEDREDDDGCPVEEEFKEAVSACDGAVFVVVWSDEEEYLTDDEDEDRDESCVWESS